MQAEELPNASVLQAEANLKSHAYIMGGMRNYPGDATKCLDDHVLAREGFETGPPYHLRVCGACLRDLKKNRMPSAALANGL